MCFYTVKCLLEVISSKICFKLDTLSSRIISFWRASPVGNKMRNNTMIDEKDYPLTFSGHETFPLRQMWLKKIVDIADINGDIPKKSFSEPEIIAELGVGKNMLLSMRHWAVACGVMYEKTTNCFSLSDFAKQILADDGLDPYSEHPSTTWLLHWALSTFGTKATTIYWVFNKINNSSFTKSDLKVQLKQLCDRRQKKVSDSSLVKDIEASLRGYLPKSIGAYEEDYADPIFGELGLLSSVENGHYVFNRGPKLSLNDATFTYALLDYWKPRKSMSSTLSLDEVAFGESSPGRIFKLDEDSIAERMMSIDELTGQRITWSNSAGIKQLSKGDFDFDDLMAEMLRKAYD